MKMTLLFDDPDDRGSESTNKNIFDESESEEGF
jgi:hypothetical protein